MGLVSWLFKNENDRQVAPEALDRLRAEYRAQRAREAAAQQSSKSEMSEMVEENPTLRQCLTELAAMVRRQYAITDARLIWSAVEVGIFDGDTVSLLARHTGWDTRRTATEVVEAIWRQKLGALAINEGDTDMIGALTPSMAAAVDAAVANVYMTMRPQGLANHMAALTGAESKVITTAVGAEAAGCAPGYARLASAAVIGLMAAKRLEVVRTYFGA
jgi:hypothetical protein